VVGQNSGVAVEQAKKGIEKRGEMRGKLLGRKPTNSLPPRASTPPRVVQPASDTGVLGRPTTLQVDPTPKRARTLINLIQKHSLQDAWRKAYESRHGGAQEVEHGRGASGAKVAEKRKLVEFAMEDNVNTKRRRLAHEYVMKY
jgi:hypothetical protein